MTTRDTSNANGLARRTLLANAAAGVALIASGAASAQPGAAGRVKGPAVWLGMDQKELNDAYDQAVYAPNRAIVLKRCFRNSELARAHWHAQAPLLWTDAGRGARRVYHQGA